MIGQLLRAVLPEPLINQLRSSPMLHQFRNGAPGRMSVGVGQGLRFEPGPSNGDYATGDNELPFQQALADSLAKDAVFYDVGANVGFFTVIGAHLVGSGGIVYAFEPIPENVAYVRLNVRLNAFRNVTVIQKAVSSASTRADLRLAEYSGGAALTTAPAPPDAKGIIRVDAVSIDDLVFKQSYPVPSVVKIDVEGAEIQVLQGMERTLREVRPTVLYEIDDANMEAFQEKYRLCESFLTQLGYRVERIADSYADIDWIVGHAIASVVSPN